MLEDNISEVDATIEFGGTELVEQPSERYMEILTSSIYQVETLGKKRLKLAGVALAEGVWKNVIYSAKEIMKAAKDMIGKPLLVEHGQTKEFGKTVVGKVINAYYDKILHALIFQAEVSHPKAIDLVNSRTLRAVSSSTWMDKKPLVGDTKIGFNYEFAELSLVRQPACDVCFVHAIEQLSKGKDLKERESNINIGDKVKESMSSEVDESLEFEEEEEEEEEFEEEPEEMLYAVLELPDEQSLEQLKMGRKVRSYYYGYYGHYPYYGYPYRYPYYGYPYKYPYRKKGQKSDVLYAIIELDSEEELDELKKIYKVKKYYKGKYGYPGYPYKGKKPEKKSEDLANSPKEAMEAWKNKTPAPGTPSPNPEQCQDEFVCPVCDKKFKDKAEFMEHWGDEHQEEYGPYKKVMKKGMLAQEPKVKIVKMKNGCFVVFKATGKAGFGAWKIIGNFATRAEAQKKIESLIEEDLAEKAIKCPVDGEEFKTHDEFLKYWADKHQEKYGEYGKYAEKKVAKKYYPYYKYYKKKKEKYPVPKEEQSAYTEFIGKCMKEKEKDIPEIKDRMKACAAEWTKKKGKPEEKSMEVEALSEVKTEETSTPASETAPTPAPVPEVKVESVPETKVEEPKEEEVKAEEKPVEEPKVKEVPTVIIKVETVQAPAPVAVAPVVPVPETKIEEKEMTMEEIMKALKGKSAELIMRIYNRK